VDNTKTRNDFCNYLAEIRLFDDEVGMVMNALKESGADENTIVIVLSEQGPQMPFGKWTCYRYGQSSAMIVRYPGKVQAGVRSDALVQYEDILPTLIDLAGGHVEGLDGISQLDVFLGKETDKRQWVYGMHNNNPEGPVYPIRSIQDKRYKLIENLTPDSAYYEKHMMNEGNNMWQSWITTGKTDDHAQWLVDRFVKRPAIEFYDHETDPWELNNLANDPQYKERIEMMDRELHRWMKEQGDRGVLMDGKNPENRHKTNT
jgi:arylsulfatase A-like enzyme